MMMPILSMGSPRARCVVLHSGRRVDLTDPPEELLIADLFRRLSHWTADPSAFGFYSMAQRTALLAEGCARRWGGPEAGLHAIAMAMPFALVGSVEPELFWALGCEQPSFSPIYTRMLLIAHKLLGLDWPMRPSVGVAVSECLPRLRLAELRCLRRGVEPEIAALEADGHTPLMPKINPQCSADAQDRLESVATNLLLQAGRPRTPLWQGVRT
ncbi:MAG: hypothetical protein ISS15_05510 [Alphaproteobacteria bacterium]|nr:hypothetical protein [Alphaproteobacteria bacterium]MBL7097097.1 hypothetical protein [Alphaproteobacteria bacterium]